MLKSLVSLKLRILMMNQMRIYPKTNKSSIMTLKCWSAGLAISIFSTILKKSTANARGSVKLRLMKADKSLILKKTILRMNWMKKWMKKAVQLLAISATKLICLLLMIQSCGR